jgi:hypothetical protein
VLFDLRIDASSAEAEESGGGGVTGALLPLPLLLPEAESLSVFRGISSCVATDRSPFTMESLSNI